MGAGFLYTCWGVFRYAASDNKASFNHKWIVALDPLGWLYGAMIIAAQLALASFPAQDDYFFPALCILAGVACLLLLLAAMTYKGTNTAYNPPASLHVFAVTLVIVILYAGYNVKLKEVDIHKQASSEKQGAPETVSTAAATRGANE
ncbi:hypothetical protein [Fundidesulfovibrio magnetotacticus]|uniref:hypothetical protein n=1 Tax=Fundidesulfovibrio magnetotacticus TaxID=2730080 RepID=UPI001564BA2C|nr:hypothetical protein [Fundidesulfovibrio magnetotacticus]